MTRTMKQTELDAILQSLALFSEGASIVELQEALTISLPSHTLQRRLAHLIKEGRVTTQGKARATKYFIVSEEESFEQNTEDTLIPLSVSAKEILKKITQPIQKRKPVGYNRNFLDSYHPNKTFYLSESIRKKLFQQGKTDGDRPAGTYARTIFNRILIDLSWNSSRLEGNTYSLLETELLLEHNEIAPGKNITETQMILNHKAAIEFLVDQKEIIKKETILNLHALLSENLLSDPYLCGHIRTKSIDTIKLGITKSVYHPLETSQIIAEYFEQIVEKARAIRDPFEQSFFLIVHLPYLQSFQELNEAVSRFAANLRLIRDNFAPLSFMDVPQPLYISGLLAIYEQNKVDLLRDIFVWAYERSCRFFGVTKQTLGEPDPFRLKYRNMLHAVVADVVKRHMNRMHAVQYIKEFAKRSIPSSDQVDFIKTVEVELMSLHEGNIARYKLRLEEYENWKKIW